MKFMYMLRYRPHEPLHNNSITVGLPASTARISYIYCLDSNIVKTLEFFFFI
jgi:hypothetical protein